jgi:hypothetical protein
MEKSQANPAGGQVVKFVATGRVELEAEVVESAFDETRGIQVHALLNNAIAVLDGDFKAVQKMVHQGDKKINCLKLNDGLICVAGQDQAASFYDPREQKAVKVIQSRAS